MSERMNVLTTGGYADICMRLPESHAGRVKALRDLSQAMLRLDRLHAADRLMALNTPGNRLEKLKGDRQGQYNLEDDLTQSNSLTFLLILLRFPLPWQYGFSRITWRIGDGATEGP